MKRRVTTSPVRSTSAVVSQAKVMRATGEVEFHYSKSKHHWWEFSKRRYVRRRLKAMKQEEG